jgi:hypothetical protein
MEKRKQRDERKEAERRQKGGYEKNAKQRASGNIHTQNRVYDGSGQQYTMPLCNSFLSVDHILWECRGTEDQRMNIDMRKELWINGNKSKEKIIVYAKEIGQYIGIYEWKKQPKSIKDLSKEEEDQPAWR